MKIDWKARLKNVGTWIGVAGIVLAAGGVTFETLTSWSLLFEAIMTILSNPVAVVGCVMAFIGVVTDTSTKGISDKKE